MADYWQKIKEQNANNTFASSMLPAADPLTNMTLLNGQSVLIGSQQVPKGPANLNYNTWRYNATGTSRFLFAKHELANFLAVVEKYVHWVNAFHVVAHNATWHTVFNNVTHVIVDTIDTRRSWFTTIRARHLS